MRIQYIILIMPCCLCEKLRKFSWEGKDCCQKSRLARLGFLGNLAKSCLRCCWTHRLATSTIFTSSEIWLSENMGKAVTVQLHLISDSSPYLYSYIAQTFTHFLVIKQLWVYYYHWKTSIKLQFIKFETKSKLFVKDCEKFWIEN